MAYKSSIIVGGSKIVIDKPMRDFMAVCARFDEDIITQSRFLKEDFDEKVKSYDDVLPKGFDLYMRSLSSFCHSFTVAAIADAFEGSHLKGNIKEFFNALLEANALAGVNAWGELFREMNVLKDKYERYKMAKSSRPDTYGGFRGGGANIGGGLSGALKASLLNLAVDAVADAANRAVDHKTLENIYKEIIDTTSLFTKNDAYLDLFAGDCTTIKNIVLDILMEEEFLPNVEGYKIGIPLDTLKEIVNSSKIDIEHYDKAISDIGELIQKRPYEPILYVALCEINPKRENEVLDFVSKNKMKNAFLKIRDPEYSPPLTKDSCKFTLD